MNCSSLLSAKAKNMTVYYFSVFLKNTFVRHSDNSLYEKAENSYYHRLKLSRAFFLVHESTKNSRCKSFSDFDQNFNSFLLGNRMEHTKLYHMVIRGIMKFRMFLCSFPKTQLARTKSSPDFVALASSFIFYFKHSRVDPVTSILAAMARSWQTLTTSWQPWIPWQDSY